MKGLSKGRYDETFAGEDDTGPINYYLDEINSSLITNFLLLLCFFIS